MSLNAPTSRDFRNAMARFPTGVAIVGTTHAGARYGMTINSLTSISLEPMLVMVSLVTGSLTGAMILARKAFTINLMGEHQEELSRRFVTKMPDRFAGVPLRERSDDLPVIAGTSGYLVCRLFRADEVGDHTVVYGEVTECEQGDHAPLVYFNSSYSRVTSWQKLCDATPDALDADVERAPD